MALIWNIQTLPNGSQIYHCDVLPSLAGDGSFAVGDWLWIMGSVSPGLYRVSTAGTGATAVFSRATGMTTANGLTAHAGGGQASGLLLTASINRITTVTSANDSVKLPPSVAGTSITVINAAAANSMNVYPSSGEAINAIAADSPFAMVANKTATFHCAVAGTWNSILTA